MAGKMPDMGPPEPVGTYQVWQRGREGFRRVFDVEAGNRLAAFILPLLDKEHEEYRRVTPLSEDARPLTYGDVIVNPAGEAYEIYKPEIGGTGFRETAHPQPQAAEQSAELDADYHAARARDFGHGDAATYDQRVREGASSVRHLEPEAPPVSPAEVDRAVAQVERQLSPTYDQKVRDAATRMATKPKEKGRER
jgi:hypothetical protein